MSDPLVILQQAKTVVRQDWRWLAICLVAAFAGSCTAAATAATVTLYGVIDLSLYYNAVSRAGSEIGGSVNSAQTGITSGVLSGSRWGIKGSEPLGGGWVSDFVLESGINAQEGTTAQGGLAFGRQATLSLSNRQFGTLDLGRKGNFAYLYMVPIDPFSLSGSQAGAGASFGSANGLRLNNFVAYETPVIRGWQAGIGYSFNTGLSAIYADSGSVRAQPGTRAFGSGVNMRALSTALRYNQGPLSLLLTYDTLYGAGDTTTDQGQSIPSNIKAKPAAWILAGSYDFKAFKIALAFGQTIHGLFLGQSAGAGGYETPLQTISADANTIFSAGARATSYLASASIPIQGRHRVLLSLQGMAPKGNLEQTQQLTRQTIFSGAYVHNLSKQTDAYIWGSYGSNYQTFTSAKSTVFGFGVRHLF